MRPSSRNSASPTEPVIGLLGAGGEVVPVVSFQSIGELEEPTKQLLPRKGFSRWTLTGISSAAPTSRGEVVFADPDVRWRFWPVRGSS